MSAARSDSLSFGGVKFDCAELLASYRCREALEQTI
jgi:hypothetical protein